MSLAHKQLIDSLVVIRNDQTRDECQKHLLKSLEMAKKRYNKRGLQEVSMIEVNENGVVKKILVPPTAIRPQKKKPSENGQNQVKTISSIIPIAPRSQTQSLASTTTSERVLLSRVSGTASDSLNSSQLVTLSPVVQNLLTYPTSSSTCTGYVRVSQPLANNSIIQPYACVNNTQQVQTIMINPPPVVINAQNQPSRPVLFSTYSQQHQPVMLTQNAINHGFGSSFVIQSNPSPVQSVIQVPRQQPQQIHLINNQPTIINSNLNQSQIYLNQPNIPNTVVITPQPRPLIINDTNQQVQGLRPVVMFQQTQGPFSNQSVISLGQTPSLLKTNQIVEIAPESASRGLSNVQKSKEKKILPKGCSRRQNGSSTVLSRDKQNFINKLVLAAERVNAAAFLPTADGTSSSLGQSVSSQRLGSSTNSLISKPKGTSKDSTESSKKLTKSLKSNNTKQTRSQESSDRGSKKSPINNIVPNYILIKSSSSTSNVATPTKSKSARVNGSITLPLGNQVPTVVLNPINIPPGVATTKVKDSKTLARHSAEARNLKQISSYRSIQPKPSVAPTANETTHLKKRETYLQTQAQSADRDEKTTGIHKKKSKLSKSNADLESDYAIAQILDKEEDSLSMWVEDEDFRDDSEAERRKIRKDRATDKSYKCYLGKSAEPTKYPRTRSFFKSRKSHS